MLCDECRGSGSPVPQPTASPSIFNYAFVTVNSEILCVPGTFFFYSYNAVFLDPMVSECCAASLRSILFYAVSNHVRQKISSKVKTSEFSLAQVRLSVLRFDIDRILSFCCICRYFDDSTTPTIGLTHTLGNGLFRRTLQPNE